jgi:hypothetical protein
VRRCVCTRNLVNEGALAQWGAVASKTNTTYNTEIKDTHLFQSETFVRACPAATPLRRACVGHAKLPRDNRKLHETNSALCSK